MSEGQGVPMVFVKGTHYQVGYQVGNTFKARIQTYVNSHPYRQQILEFYETDDGRAFCDGLLCVCSDRYPHYMEEIRGIAEGAQLPVKELNLLHLEKEILIFLQEITKMPTQRNAADLEEVDLGCVDILLNSDEQMILAHNMDFYTSHGETLYVVHAHILPYVTSDGRKFPEERFMCHQYTGFLFGGNCSMNKHGLVYTLAALYPKVALQNRIPELFLRREFLSATSPENALGILKSVGCGVSTGLAMSFGFMGDSRLWNVEVGPCPDSAQSEIDVHILEKHGDSQYYPQFNNYVRLKLPSYRGDKSEKRRKRFASLPPPSDVNTIRNILGCTEDGQDAIYNGKEKTRAAGLNSSTIYTVVFDMNNQEYNLYQGNPKMTDPIISLPFFVSSG